MPFVYDDEFEIANEYSLGLSTSEEYNKDRYAHVLADIPIGNIEKKEKKKNKINIISIETLTKKINVHKNITKDSYITKTIHVPDDGPKPNTSALKCIPSRRSSYYKNDNDILKDLMNENII